MPERRILTGFQLDKIAAVDKPAQEGALMTIMKRADTLVDAIAKAAIDDGAKTFHQVFNENEAQQKKWEAREELWPVVDALRDSVNSTITDETLTADQRLLMVEQSAADFAAKVRDKFPDIEDELMKLMKAGDAGATRGKEDSMPNIEEQIAALEKKVSDLEKSDQDKDEQIKKLEAEKADAEVLAKMSDAEKAHMKGMDAEAKGKFMGMKPEDRAAAMNMKKAEDETVEIEGQTISKSEVGEGPFAVMKAQAEKIKKAETDIAKERDARETAELEKRAGEEFAHVPGTDSEIAALLKAANGMDEEVKKTFDSILKATEDLTKGAFSTVGHNNGQMQKGRGDFMKRVSEIQTSENCSRTVAMQKAQSEFPEEFQAYQGTAAN